MVFGTNVFMNSTFIYNGKPLTLLSQSEGDAKIDDFKKIFDSVQVRIIWLLSWIVLESFTNANHFFIIMFEKYGGMMTLSCGNNVHFLNTGPLQ